MAQEDHLFTCKACGAHNLSVIMSLSGSITTNTSCRARVRMPLAKRPSNTIIAKRYAGGPASLMKDTGWSGKRKTMSMN